MSSIFGIETGIGLITWARQGPSAARAEVLAVGTRRLSREQIAAAAATASRHPNYRALWEIGTSYPVRTSDHVVLREFWPTDVWREQHGHCDGRYPVGFAVSCSSPNQVKFIGMHRSDRDFSDEEVSALAAIQTLLTPALQFRSCLDSAAIRLRASTEVDDPPVDYRPTHREAEVLCLASREWTARRIGRKLGISDRTVRKHLGAVYEKAGVSGRATAAVWWTSIAEPKREGNPAGPDPAGY